MAFFKSECQGKHVKSLALGKSVAVRHVLYGCRVFLCLFFQKHISWPTSHLLECVSRGCSCSCLLAYFVVLAKILYNDII